MGCLGLLTAPAGQDETPNPPPPAHIPDHTKPRPSLPLTTFVLLIQVTNFLHADVAMPIPRSPGSNVPFRLSLRAALNQAEVKAAPHKMLLHDAVLVSYYQRQVKIAELPLDSFRMLQVGAGGGGGSGRMRMIRWWLYTRVSVCVGCLCWCVFLGLFGGQAEGLLSDLGFGNGRPHRMR